MACPLYGIPHLRCERFVGQCLFQFACLRHWLVLKVRGTPYLLLKVDRKSERMFLCFDSQCGD